MITAVLSGSHPRGWESVLESLLRNPLVRKAVVLHSGEPGICPSRCEMLAVDGPMVVNEGARRSHAALGARMQRSELGARTQRLGVEDA